MAGKTNSGTESAKKRKASTTVEKKPVKKLKIKKSGDDDDEDSSTALQDQLAPVGNSEKGTKAKRQKKQEVMKSGMKIKSEVDSGSDGDDDYTPSQDAAVSKRSPRPKRKASRKKTAPVKKKGSTLSKQEFKKEVKAEAEILKEESGSAAATKPTSRQKQMKAPNKYVGAHTSIAGGLENAVSDALEIGARAFGLFLKSQRQWASKPLDPKAAEKFRQACKEHDFAPCHIVPHGSYLMNCASPNDETLRKSWEMLADELKRCEMMGLTIFNFHPGSTCGEISVEEGVQRIADSINAAHKQTKYVTAVLENMCRQGNTIGGHFEELGSIIEKVKDKSRVGVCLDTCHTYAAGYDIKTEEGYKETMETFDKAVGFKYLRAVHVNDSEGELGCHRDRHANIGRGKIGLDGFRHIMNDSRFNNIPLILETPAHLSDKSEIKILLGKLGCHKDRHANIGKGMIGLDGFRNIMNDSRFDNIPFILETPQTQQFTYQKEIKTLLNLCADDVDNISKAKKKTAKKI